MSFRPQRSSRTWVACIAAATALAIGAGSPAAATSSDHNVAIGAYLGSSQHPARILRRYSGIVGERPAIVASYVQWRFAPFSRSELYPIWQCGAVPMITWEPWSLGRRPFSLQRIAAGRYDPYVRSAARAAAAWGHPILLRFAQEMNGNWYPWGRAHASPATYKAAWRHLVRIFRAEGASNVKWVWTPNVDNNGRYPFASFYPGDRWVDWVGLDGFNWGAREGWQWFGEVFDRSYRQLARISSRPMIIAETGSGEIGGSKARWVRRALGRELPRLARVRALIWFDQPFNGLDVRVNSSAAALRALRQGIRAPIYRSGGVELIRELTSSIHF